MQTEFTQLDRQKTKLLVFFSALGLAGFILTMLAGVGLWSYSKTNRIEVPTYDRFVSELRRTSDAQLPGFAKSTFESWSACESRLDGMTSVAVHATVTGSVAGIVFFAICLVLGWQLHQKISRVTSAGAPPQPPEPVDDTWRQGR
jgi:hypothetical protein